MSDTSPTNQAALLSSHRPSSTKTKPRPREILFEFDTGHRRWRAELLDDGSDGVEARIVSADDRFFSARRCLSRELAERWLLQQRRDLEFRLPVLTRSTATS